MDEVDRIILARLQQIGCEFQDDVKSLKSLSQAEFADAVVRCLSLISPDLSFATSKLPANVAARYQFATSLAEAIASIGYKGTVGYQMILYGSETDSRRLLMFLIEKLPKETSYSLSTTTAISGLERAKRIVSDRLRRELQSQPAPFFLKVYQSELLNFYWRQPYVDGDLSFQSDFVLMDPYWKNLHYARQVPSTALTLNRLLFSSKTVDIPVAENDDISLLMEARRVEEAFQLSADASVPVPRRRKPPVPLKPAGLRKAAPESSSEKEKEADVPTEDMEKQVESLTREIEVIELEVDRRNDELTRLKGKLEEIETVTRTMENTVAEKQASMKQLTLAAELAPNMDEHLKQLKDYIGKSDSRMDELAASRDELCSKLHQEIAQIKQNSLNKSEPERLLEEIDVLERKANDTLNEMQAKKSHLQILQREYDRMEKVINRDYYTKRILEIVANVNKQKQEIARVLNDIRDSQKDVNMLSGKLERSFMATDELLYKDATRDDLIKRAYKCFFSLHELCAKIISHIENSGHLEREMRDLEDQIDTESQRSVDATSESLISDYCEMKQANESLFTKLKDLGIYA